MDSWAKLNGYIDGELDVREAAEIAVLASEQPNVAKQIAELHKLKAELASCTETYPRRTTFVSTSSITSVRRWFVAAGLAFLAFGVATLVDFRSSAGPAGIAAQLVEEHEVWAASIADISPEPNGDAIFVHVHASDRSTGNRFPELTSIGLSLHRVEGRRIGKKYGWLLGYLGRNGCRASLFVVEQADAPDSTPRKLQLGNAPVHTWSQGGRAYFLTATQMSEQRLLVVSEALFLRTAEPAQPDIKTMAVLRERYSESTSCLG